MGRLTTNQCCDVIVEHTGLLAAALTDGALGQPVPSCPGWTVRHLVRHVGAGHRWAEEIVRTRAGEPIPDTELRDLDAHPRDDAATIATWLRDGAAQLSATLRSAPPALDVWTPVPGMDGDFWPRRFAHETLVHRADAELALDRPFSADALVVADAIDEWFELGTLPLMLEIKPDQRELLGPGHTIELHSIDTDESWLLDLTGETMTWRPSAEPAAAVTWLGPLTELLLALYRRRPPRGDRLVVEGDDALFDAWLARVGFG